VRQYTYIEKEAQVECRYLEVEEKGCSLFICDSSTKATIALYGSERTLYWRGLELCRSLQECVGPVDQRAP
jgi:hypothetical protein